MTDKTDSRNTPYNGERNTEPPKQTGDINYRNNNVEVSTPGNKDVNVERGNNEGIGDAAVNDQRMTDYTSNHSADA